MDRYLEESVSLDKYFKIREESDALLEYIDGFIYMSPSPSTEHQRISRKLLIAFADYLKNSPCEIFPVPYDIELKRGTVDETQIVIPDLSIICDKKGFTSARYIGVPLLVVEILSPSNQSHDLITKLNIYMRYGVQEYWIVNPMLHTITVYTLNEDHMYEQYDIKAGTGEITSKSLDGFLLDISPIFGAE